MRPPLRLLLPLVLLAAACSPSPETPPGVVHLIPDLTPGEAAEAVWRRSEATDRDLLATASGWRWIQGRADEVPGAAYAADGEGSVALLSSPGGLELAADLLAEVNLDLECRGVSRVRLALARPGEDLEGEMAAPRSSHPRIYDVPVPRDGPLRLRADGLRLAGESEEPFDRVLLAAVWQPDAPERSFAVRGIESVGAAPRGELRFRAVLDGVNRDAIALHGGTSMFADVRVPLPGKLLTFTARLGPGGEDEAFEVRVHSGGRTESVARWGVAEAESWTPREADLSAWAGQSVRVELRAVGPSRTRFVWGAPLLTGPVGERGHVLLWTIDTLRSDVLGASGFPGRTSPHLDRLARRGVQFSDVFSTTSWTRPAMASVMTSLPSPAHGAYLERQAIRAELPTLAESMQRAGYVTIALISNPNAGRSAGLDRGYDLVVEVNELFRDFVAKHRNEPGQTRSRTMASGTSRWIHSWLEDAWPPLAGVPVFVYAHVNDPHGAYEPASPFSLLPGMERERLEGARMRRWWQSYGRDVAVADHYFGRTMRLLEDLGLREQTTVLMVADHGEEFREHGDIGHGWNLWPEQVRIPMLLAGPGVPARNIHDGPASLLDVGPTLLETLGLPPLEGAEGNPLVAASTDPEVDAGPRFLHLIEHRTRLSKDPGDPVGDLALVEDGWKLILRDYSREEDPVVLLYDLTEDPGEKHDVAAEYPELVRSMSLAALEQWRGEMAEAKDGAVPAEMDAETEEILRALGYLD